MESEALGLLVRANLAAGAAILLILALRTPVAQRFGARVAYAMWAIVPLAAAASVLPPRTVELLAEDVSALDAATAMSFTGVVPAGEPLVVAAAALESVAADASWNVALVTVAVWF